MDLTEYGENELSMQVYNVEGLYLMRASLTKECLEEMGYQFTEEQWEMLQDDIEQDEEL